METDTVKCGLCGNDMPIERLEFYKTCVKCTDQSTYQGFQVFDHKTTGHAVLIKSNNKEALRQAERANRRAR